jgi:Fur family ferric uptake transcriptional regulator
MATMTQKFHDRAETLVQRSGARVTRQRVEVLAVLLAARRALTHHEVESRANHNLGIDRVTVYRVLEWLTSRNLAHKIAGDDRVWRFNAAGDEGERSHSHAHFKCNDCGEVICLDKAIAARNVPLPSGYRSQEIELTVKGLCADCVPARADRHRPQAHAQHRH